MKKSHINILLNPLLDEEAKVVVFQNIRRQFTLNLNVGIKVNYTKFGDLLSEVKVVIGGMEE